MAQKPKKVPPVAPAPTYTRNKPAKPEKKPKPDTPLKRLVKFAKGEYTRKEKP